VFMLQLFAHTVFRKARYLQQHHGRCSSPVPGTGIKIAPPLVMRRPRHHLPVGLYQLRGTSRHSFKMSQLFFLMHCTTVLISCYFQYFSDIFIRFDPSSRIPGALRENAFLPFPFSLMYNMQIQRKASVWILLYRI
jgi:hypothetical protein